MAATGDDPIVHVALPRIQDDPSECVRALRGFFSRLKGTTKVRKYRVEVSNRARQKLAGQFQPAQLLFFKARHVLGQTSMQVVSIAATQLVKAASPPEGRQTHA